MKAIILSHEKGGSYVLDRDGSFRFLKGYASYAVGSEIEFKLQPAIDYKVIALAACFILFAAFGGFSYLLSAESYSVYIDINPSVELVFNGMNTLKTAKGLNGDGEALLAGLDLKGAPGGVILQLIGAAEAKGYIEPHGDSPVISITIAERGGKSPQEYERIICAALESASLQSLTEVCVCNAEARARAEELGVSPGTLRMAERWLTLTSEPSMSLEEIIRKPASELIAEVREAEIIEGETREAEAREAEARGAPAGGGGGEPLNDNGKQNGDGKQNGGEPLNGSGKQTGGESQNGGGEQNGGGQQNNSGEQHNGGTAAKSAGDSDAAAKSTDNTSAASGSASNSTEANANSTAISGEAATASSGVSEAVTTSPGASETTATSPGAGEATATSSGTSDAVTSSSGAGETTSAGAGEGATVKNTESDAKNGLVESQKTEPTTTVSENTTEPTRPAAEIETTKAETAVKSGEASEPKKTATTTTTTITEKKTEKRTTEQKTAEQKTTQKTTAGKTSKETTQKTTKQETTKAKTEKSTTKNPNAGSGNNSGKKTDTKDPKK